MHAQAKKIFTNVDFAFVEGGEEVEEEPPCSLCSLEFHHCPNLISAFRTLNKGKWCRGDSWRW